MSVNDSTNQTHFQGQLPLLPNVNQASLIDSFDPTLGDTILDTVPDQQYIDEGFFRILDDGEIVVTTTGIGFILSSFHCKYTTKLEAKLGLYFAPESVNNCYQETLHELGLQHLPSLKDWYDSHHKQTDIMNARHAHSMQPDTDSDAERHISQFEPPLDEDLTPPHKGRKRKPISLVVDNDNEDDCDIESVKNKTATGDITIWDRIPNEVKRQKTKRGTIEIELSTKQLEAIE